MNNVRIKDYLYIEAGDIDCDTEIINNKEIYIPDMYILWFKYHDTEFKATFHVTNLLHTYLFSPTSLETTGDLMASFEEQLEDKFVINSILSYIKDLWNNYVLDNNKYNYLGQIINKK